MPTMFEYTVRDRQGKTISGTMDAESPAAAAQKLTSMGYSPLTVTKKGKGLKKELSLPGFGKPGLKDLAIFSRQFATMINSGLSLLRSLAILTEQTQNPELARVIGQVRGDVESGQSLSSAMAKYPEVFPPLMVNMCRAGEVGGFLDTVLLEIAANYEAEVKLRGKVKAAMTYPVVVGVLALLAVMFMLLWIVPMFAAMFDELNTELPLPTQVLVGISNKMKIIAPVLIVLCVTGVVVYRRNKHKEKVRNVVDPMKLKAPVFGSLFQKIAISRFSRNLGTMLRSGVPILQALDIVADTTGNIVVTRAVRDVQESVRGGESLAGPLAGHEIFPPMVVQMLAVGEDTGALDTMLDKIAQFYDQEVEATTESLTAMLEPLMIAVLGSIIGGMIIVLYLPMFKIYEALG